MSTPSRAHRQARRGHTPSRVAKKAIHLMHAEGKSREEAFGEAFGMERAGRLTAEGGYIRARRKRSRRG